MISSCVAIASMASLTWIVSVASTQQDQTRFIEPLKNITTSSGTNIELSCSILHLGNARVIWFFKPPQESVESILAVNGLKVTRNPKISFSLIPRSGDVMESILYLFNVGSDEGGVYTCGVNTEPMIFQRGTLEISEKTKEAVGVTTESGLVTPPPSVPSLTKDAKSSDDTFCFNIPQFLKDTKREAEKFTKNMWEKVTSLF